ncbi:MAG TPA: GNAT family N-acetyltransferase [Candidatus Binataceae bacterium]|nr:GNAT family N-acetyltransferase [Candidatus Binataceae bacterium]
MASDDFAAYLAAAFPKTARLRDGTQIILRPFTAADRAQVCAFFERVPEDDRAFLKEDVINRAEAEAWLDRLDSATETMIVAASPDRVAGTAVLAREAHGWARHVGEIRIVADPATRRVGLGHVLAETIFALAVRLGLEKIIAQMMADQAGAVRVFELLGFRTEATLRNHVKDRYGYKHDLIVMVNDLALTAYDDERMYVRQSR